MYKIYKMKLEEDRLSHSGMPKIDSMLQSIFDLISEIKETGINDKVAAGIDILMDLISQDNWEKASQYLDQSSTEFNSIVKEVLNTLKDALNIYERNKSALESARIYNLTIFGLEPNSDPILKWAKFILMELKWN